MKNLLMLGLLLAQFACALPETITRTGSTRPTISIKGAPVDSDLLIDGLVTGKASRFDGTPTVLTVEEGTHLLSIVTQGKVVHSEKIFIGNGETRAVTLNLGN